MLNRKEFLKNSAAVVISYAGISDVVMLTNRLLAADAGSADLYAVPIKTGSLADMMNDIDFFGEPGETVSVSDGLFSPGMELGKFTRLYCDDIMKRYSRKPDKSGVYEAIPFSRLCDSYLQLLESLIRMSGNTFFEFYVRSLQNDLPPEHSGILKSACRDIAASITYADKKWQTDLSYAPVITGKKCVAGLVLHGGTSYTKEYSFAELNIPGIDPVSYTDAYRPGRGFAEVKEFAVESISASRYMCKAVFSRYTLLDSFEKYYSSLPQEKETITQKNKITSGARQFTGKLMLALLFIELTLMRMELVCYRSSSGIFSDNNRYMFQAEFSSLVETIQDLTGRPVFSGKRIFGGDFAVNPAMIKIAGTVKNITVPLLDVGSLGLGNTAEGGIVMVDTAGGTDQASLALKMALKKIRNLRQRISGGLSI